MIKKPVQLIKRFSLSLLSFTLFLTASSTPAFAQYWAENVGNIYNTNGGFVGIGTSTPARKLTIFSTVDPYILQQASDGTSEINLNMWNTGSGKQLYLGLVGNSGQLVAGSVQGDVVLRNQGGNIKFSTDGGNSSAMTLTEAGKLGLGYNFPTNTLEVNGTAFIYQQLGIGMAPTADRLSVNGRVTSTDKLYPGSGAIQTANGLGYSNSTGELTLGSAVVTGTLNMGNQTVKNVYKVESYSNSPLRLDALGTGDILMNGTEMVVKDGGNVGIGTATPAEKLDVNGRVRLAQTTAPATVTDKLYNVGGALYWNGSVLGGGGGGSTSWSSLTAPTANLYLDMGSYNTAFNTTGGNNTFFIDGVGGRVGIGTNSPDDKLSIYAGGTSPNISQITYATGPEVHLNMTSGVSGINKLFLGLVGTAGQLTSGSNVGDVVLRSDNGAIKFTVDAGTNTPMVLSPAGNLGIGTSSPADKLNVIDGGIVVGFTRPAPIDGILVRGKGIFGGNLTGAPSIAKLVVSDDGDGVASIFQRASANGAEINLQMNNFSGKSLFLGLVGTAGQLVTGSLLGDAVLRNDGPILFTTDGGNSVKMTVNTNGLTVNGDVTASGGTLVGSNVTSTGVVSFTGSAGVVITQSISATGTYTTTVTYPVARPSAAAAITLTHDNNGTGDMYVDRIRIKKGSVTNTGFQFEWRVAAKTTNGTTKFAWNAF